MGLTGVGVQGPLKTLRPKVQVQLQTLVQLMCNKLSALKVDTKAPRHGSG